MRLADLYHEAIVWTCYLENFPDPERFLSIYGLSERDRLSFDCLGRFFPFNEFYARERCVDDRHTVYDLRVSNKPFLLPWIYKPTGTIDTISGKYVICPPEQLFTLLDSKLETKMLFKRLGFLTPEQTVPRGDVCMVEKPVCNSAGGLGIQLTGKSAREGFFLEEYIEGCQSFGLHFFVYDEVELICADEMLYYGESDQRFMFSAQVNVGKDELPQTLVADCFRCVDYLKGMGYRGFLNIDALSGERGHYLLEVNPRGGAFLPAFFAATSAGWTHFITGMRQGRPEKDELVLLDFGESKKVVKKRS
jgi:hypothetical protein